MEIDTQNSIEDNNVEYSEDTCPVHEAVELEKGKCLICNICYSCK